MNILILGGSGLLGSHIAAEALERGHKVSILSRGFNKSRLAAEEQIRFIHGDVHSLSENELKICLTGQDALVYALGIDDRTTYRRPAYAQFHEDHVLVCSRVLKAARKSGVKKFVVLGSYFTYLADRFPELTLTRDHSYIRTRAEQRDAVLKETGPGFDTFVLELPYILGSQEGKVPPWTFIFSMLATRGKKTLFFLKGGTAAVTARQVGRAALGALERGIGGRAYPLGGRNYAWAEFARKYFEVSGREKKLLNLPPPLFTIFGVASALLLRLRGRERGLNIARFAKVQYMDAFVDPEPSMSLLGYEHEEYDAALEKVIREWIKLQKT